MRNRNATENVVCVILAAGKGKRMQKAGNADRQKVLVKIQRRPMLGYVLDAVCSVGIKRAIVVVGHHAEEVEQYLGTWRRRLEIETVRQEQLLGTADAVKRTEKFLLGYEGDVLVLYGDTPLLTERTLRKFLETHRSQKNDCTLLTTHLENPVGYGRIVHNGRSESVAKIVEEVDATAEEKKLTEINVGVYCFRVSSLFGALKEVTPNNQKHEYYLTDTVAILVRKQKAVRSVLTQDPRETVGVNSPVELEKARKAFGGCPPAKSER
ncbi:MAG: sugar phosphate nucleotidyltransferase [Candidatus Omnitrophota bacterium]